MNRFSDFILDYKGQNPFSDSQARNFSDTKVCNEFYPISSFWTLFNDQHEVLLGTRGCGKTFLLKMMRYSMLKKIEDPRAKELIKKKEFIGVYVPMHLEFVALLNSRILTTEQQILLFQCAFNCLLAESLITELKSLINEEENLIKRAKKTAIIVKMIDEIWFNVQKSEIYEIDTLSNKISKVFYNIDWNNPVFDVIPVIFRRQICSPLASVKSVIGQILHWDEEPTWIICIDEAEFLNETVQKCINSMFRSDTSRIALKVATLPYYHATLETLDSSISVVNGNDFSYRTIDMVYNGNDFVNLSNALCSHRLKSRFDEDRICNTLEDFLGRVGKDDQIDYFRTQFGEKESQREYIEKRIIESFPYKRRQAASTYSNKRKTVYDKYAPIYFIREMYNESKKGNTKPGWYAGAVVVRRVSQGNPRLFIRLMSELFERAKKIKLDPKNQCEVIYKFAENICKSTNALEAQGPKIYKELKGIAEHLHKKTHNGDLISIGCAFTLKYIDKEEYEKSKEWLQLAIAYSRLIVEDDVKINGITEKTKFLLANTYATAYWLAMRGDTPVRISVNGDMSNIYFVDSIKKNNNYEHQISLFEEDNEW